MPSPSDLLASRCGWRRRSWYRIAMVLALGICLFFLVRAALPSGREDGDLVDAVARGNTAAANAAFQRLRRGPLLRDRCRGYEDVGMGFHMALCSARSVPEAEVRIYFGAPDHRSGWFTGDTVLGYSYDKHGKKDGMLFLRISPKGVLTQVGFGLPEGGRDKDLAAEEDHKTGQGSNR